MDTAAGIKIGEFFPFGEFWPVGMAANKHHFVPPDPLFIILLYFMAFKMIPGRAGGIMKSYYMHEPPEIP